MFYQCSDGTAGPLPGPNAHFFPQLQTLTYHPHYQAQYTAETCRLSPFTSQFDMNSEDVKRQFFLAEQASGGNPGGYPNASREQQYSGMQPAASLMQLQPQQVPAYRPMMDPTLAAAMASRDQLAAAHALAMQGSTAAYYMASAGVPQQAMHGHHAHAAAVAAAATAIAAQRAASGMYPEPTIAYSGSGFYALSTEC